LKIWNKALQFQVVKNDKGFYTQLWNIQH
jgi:hypothetical protein